MAAWPKLPLDVLIRVFAFTRTADLAHTVYASRAIHDITATELLRRGVVLVAETQLRSFSKFMTREPERRVRILTKLSIHGPEDQDEFGPCTALIARILQQCSRVESLSLHAFLFDIDVRIGAAVAALECVKQLTILDAGGIRNLTPFLSVLRSNCVEVHIDYTPAAETWYDSEVRSDPNFTLLSCVDSLERLALFSPVFDMDAVVYPRLTTLQVDNYTYNLRPLLRSFPNLRHLLLVESSADRHPHKREENRLAASQNPWTLMEYLDASISDLFILSLNFPIRRWKTLYEHIEDDSGDSDYFTECIRATQPTALELTLYARKNALFEPVAHALRQCKLSHLRLTLHLYGLDLMSVTKLMDQLLHYVEEQGLFFLELHLRCQHPDAARDMRKLMLGAANALDLHDELVKNARRITEEVAVYDHCRAYSGFAKAEELFSSCKSLQFFFCRFYSPGPESVEDAYWTVNRDGSGANVISLNIAEVRDTIDREGMREIYAVDIVRS